eukprot:scaffold247378_cov14-Tisochrysis_lutea.AAC.1
MGPACLTPFPSDFTEPIACSKHFYWSQRRKGWWRMRKKAYGAWDLRSLQAPILILAGPVPPLQPKWTLERQVCVCVVVGGCGHGCVGVLGEKGWEEEAMGMNAKRTVHHYSSLVA